MHALPACIPENHMCASGPLELELKIVVSCHVSAGSQPQVDKQTMLSTAEPPLQPQVKCLSGQVPCLAKITGTLCPELCGETCHIPMEKVIGGEVHSSRENLKVKVKLRLMWLVFYAEWD